MNQKIISEQESNQHNRISKEEVLEDIENLKAFYNNEI